MSTPHYSKLIGHLERQTTLVKAFVQLMDRELAALQTMSMEELVKLSKHKESGLRQLTYLDEQVQETLAEMTPAGQQEVYTLRSLAATLPEEEGKELLEIRQSLHRLRSQISDKNYINHSFTTDTLRYITDAIALIAAQSISDPVYTPRGMGKAYNSTPAIFSRAV